MKWKIKENKEHESGDRRNVTKFAWLPVKAKIKNDWGTYRVWLEFYTEVQEYMYFPDNWSSDKDRWVPIENWV